jgi:hypothetical protein
VLGGLAALLGVATAWTYPSAGLSLSHSDAKAHLVVARRILDSITPNWEQIGAVWLPLPHVLNALPVQIDFLYRTGASAIAISIASFAVTAAPVGAAAPISSQRWHRDPGVGRICKAFLYLTDVDEKSGPFTYFAGSQPGGQLQRLLPHRFFGKGSYYPPDGAVEGLLKKHGAQDRVRVNTGPAGMVIFCNTMGLHKGGYATERRRIMITSFYKSGESRVPPHLRFPINFETRVEGLADISRYAIATA